VGRCAKSEPMTPCGPATTPSRSSRKEAEAAGPPAFGHSAPDISKEGKVPGGGRIEPAGHASTTVAVAAAEA
jgi:hypothetical protein